MKKAKPTVSVIIPIYNVESYLERCINSVVLQTYNDVEVLLIDDGSTDCSGQIADEYAKNLNGVQIMPVANYVIVRPFKENPFQKVKVDPSSGLIIDLGGMVPEYKSNESGDYEEAEQVIKVGVVIEAGPECKWLRSGDTIMWAKMSEVVVPFYNFGFRLVNETRAICVINDDLNERFNLK